MSELDVHLAAAYLKRVSLSSSALDELLEEESTRKLRRVSSSNNLEEGQNVGSTGVRFDGSPKGKEHGRRLRGADDMRRVVSADDMRRAAPGAAPDETLRRCPTTAILLFLPLLHHQQRRPWIIC